MYIKSCHILTHKYTATDSALGLDYSCVFNVGLMEIVLIHK